MTQIPNVWKAREAIRKVGLISSPATSEAAAEALVELVRSGELLILADFADAVLKREPDAYINRSALGSTHPETPVPLERPHGGKEFAFSTHHPVFIGSMTDKD